MAYLEVFQTTFALFVLIAIGYFSRKKKLIDEQTTVDFSRFVIRILFPIYLFQASSTYMSKEYVLTAPVYFLLNAFLIVILFFVSKLISKLAGINTFREPAFRLCAIVGNTGFFGLSFAASFFGPEAVIVGTLYDFGSSVPFFMILIPYLFQKKEKKNLRTIFGEPSIIAVLAGLICGLIGFRIPAFLMPSFEMASGITLPLALIMCGSQLAGVQTFSGNKYIQVSWVILVKMVLSPLILMAMVWFLPIPALMKQFLVLDAAMPTGISMVNFARVYNQDSDFAAVSIFATTVFSILWLPVLMIGLPFIF